MADVVVESPKICPPVQVFAFARLSDTTTLPVVGEIMSVPSEFVTELTEPLPDPQGKPAPETTPVEEICRHCVPPLLIVGMVREEKFPFVAKRFVELAVVAKKFVEVAFVVVALPKIAN